MFNLSSTHVAKQSIVIYMGHLLIYFIDTQIELAIKESKN